MAGYSLARVLATATATAHSLGLARPNLLSLFPFGYPA